MTDGVSSKLLRWIIVICISVMEYNCQECPDNCACSSAEGNDSGIPLVSCTGSLPSSIPRTVTHLDVNHANIPILTAVHILPLGKLASLFIISSRISLVEENAFSSIDMKNLKYLRLSNNEIPLLGNNTFSNLQELEELFLDGNNIRNVEGVFYKLTRLQVLHLESNYLEEIPHDLPLTLTDLFLNDNNIHRVEFFGRHTSLHHLNLCGNSFSRLSHERVSIPENLESLCLGNQFYEIDPLLFTPEGGSLKTLVMKTTKKLTPPTLDAIGKLHELESLTISGAKIVKLSFGTPKFLPKLHSLALINIKYTPDTDKDFFSFDLFRELDVSSSPNIADIVLNNEVSLTNLKVLKIRNTSITDVSDDMKLLFLMLEQLDISDNDLKCDCNLRSIIRNSHKKKSYLLSKEDTRCFQESTQKAYQILDNQLRIMNCNEIDDGESKSIDEDNNPFAMPCGSSTKAPHAHDTSSLNNLFYIIVSLIIVVAVLFMVIFYLLVKYLRVLKKKRCRVSTIF